jgi:hypothetical protein
VNHVLLAVGVWLADDAPPGTGPEFGKATPFGLLVVVLLLIGVGFLVWSMNRHLKKLPESFDRDDPAPDQAADDGTVGGNVRPDQQGGSCDRDGSSDERDG